MSCSVTPWSIAVVSGPEKLATTAGSPSTSRLDRHVLGRLFLPVGYWTEQYQFPRDVCPLAAPIDPVQRLCRSTWHKLDLSADRRNGEDGDSRRFTWDIHADGSLRCRVRQCGHGKPHPPSRGGSFAVNVIRHLSFTHTSIGLEWGPGFRPDALQALVRRDGRFQLTDTSGQTATIEGPERSSRPSTMAGS